MLDVGPARPGSGGCSTGPASLLIEEINATPPAMPGDIHPITYHLTPRPGLTLDAHPLPSYEI